MAVWINLPANLWFDTKLFQQKLMTLHHVVDHILIVWASFIMHRPACTQEFPTTLLDKLSKFLLCLIILHAPPHGEILHFSVGKSSFGVLFQSLKRICYDIFNLYIRKLCSTIEVLRDCFNPSNIIVSVGHTVNI
jgi:hypothetical protein